MSLNKNQTLRIFNLRRFGPRLSFIANKFIITKNYSVSHFVGDHENMVSFASHVQQLSLGALFCNFNNYNFYSKKHPYFENFSIINDKRNSFFHFLRKDFVFFTSIGPKQTFLKDLIIFLTVRTTFRSKRVKK